ncbi:MAG: D-alanyl-D-alanine carboxypeptidase [Gammaproteobacteria bacterium]|jgi:serine-type D-Ala-D-Ala carboxypeptidase (penicillin-binding protein 5/6)
MQFSILRPLSAALALAVSLSPAAYAQTPTPAPTPAAPVPAAPDIPARAFVVMDYSTSQVLAARNAHKRAAPASLTKLMVAYIVFRELQAGRIHLNDEVTVSKKAWRTGGSRMFLRVGTKVTVRKLIEGMIVDSGNDATVTLAQDVAGTTGAFVQFMNSTAQQLGMKDTHYSDVDGLPIANHYSTPYDLALLTRDIIRNFPDYYHFFKLGHLTYDHITQYNRNKLLWRDSSVDGLKTGYTKAAGYCLTASAKRGNMRLITVVMGTDSEKARVTQSEALLNWGFRFYKTHTVYQADKPVIHAKVWKGTKDAVPLGPAHPIKVTVARGHYDEIKPVVKVDKRIMAPIKQGAAYGTITLSLDGKVLAKAPLVALTNVQQGAWWKRLEDDALLYFKG